MEVHDRLRHALQAAGIAPRASGGAPRPAFQRALATQESSGPGIEAFLPGFWQDTPAGRVFVIERRYELDQMHGRYPLGRALEILPPILARVGRNDALATVQPDKLLYLDTETTGLAGGTGTLAFLVGIGHFVDGGFRLRQYFLDSLDREGALLSALSDYLDPFEAVVTYNGKIFDVPLLETRFILSRLSSDIRALPHVDLLFAVRRFYRDRFESCRLGQIERQVLGMIRHDDVPGFEVPSLFFRYQRYRRFRALLPVFEHNALDILSLVTLAVHLTDFMSGDGIESALDRLALARVCERDGHFSEAAEHYAGALGAGLPPVPRDEAEQRLSLLHKRAARWDEATEIWYRIAYRPENRLVYPLLELARYCERQRHDLPASVVHLEHALALLRRHHLRLGSAGAEAQADRIHRRLLRLRARDARALGSQRPGGRSVSRGRAG